jgi:hypothetical protein
LVLIEPLVPRSGRLKNHHPKSTVTRRIPAPMIIPALFMMIHFPGVTPIIVQSTLTAFR